MADATPPNIQRVNNWYESVNPTVVESNFLTIDPETKTGHLGPFYHSKEDETLNLNFPLTIGEELPINQPKLDLSRWSQIAKSRVWPSVLPYWTKWVNRIIAHRHSDLLSSGIHDAILISKQPIAMNHNALAAVMNFWSVSTNSFHFQFGMMTPTLLDVHALTGLSPLGEVIDANLTTSTSTTFTRQFSSYKEMADNYMKTDGNVEDEEYIAFLLLWICRYLTCTPSYCIKQSEVKLAIALSEGRLMSMGTYVLSFLYRSCFNLVNSGFTSYGGPFWILQLWLHAYFPCQLPSESIILPECVAFGPQYIQFDPRKMSLSNIFSFFHKKKSYIQPVLFKQSNEYPQWLRPSDAKSDLWAHYLIARDLPYGLVIEHSRNNRCGVETYNPHLVACQFGLKQCNPVPYQFSANETPSTRVLFSSTESVNRLREIFGNLLSRFIFAPFTPVQISARHFEDFWKKYIDATWLMTLPAAISSLSTQLSQGQGPQKIKTTVPNPLFPSQTPKKRKASSNPVRRSNRQVRKTKPAGPADTIQLTSSNDTSKASAGAQSTESGSDDTSETSTGAQSTESESETVGENTLGHSNPSSEKNDHSTKEDDEFVGVFKTNPETKTKFSPKTIGRASSSVNKKVPSPDCKKSLSRAFGGSTSGHPTPIKSNRYEKLFDGLLFSPLKKVSSSHSDLSTKSQLDRTEGYQVSAEEIVEAQNIILGLSDKTVAEVARMKAEILRALDVLGNQSTPMFPIDTLKDSFLQIFPAHEAFFDLGAADDGLQHFERISIELAEKEIQVGECQTDVLQGNQATEALKSRVSMLEEELRIVKQRLIQAEHMRAEDEHRLIICQDDVSKLRQGYAEAENNLAALKAKKELATHTIHQAEEQMETIKGIINIKLRP